MARAKALNASGVFAWLQGDFLAARAVFEEMAIRREMGDAWGVAMSLNLLGLMAYDKQHFTAAREFHQESLVIRREIGDRKGVSLSLEGPAPLAASAGKPDRAALLWRAAERLREEMSAPIPPNDLLLYEAQVAAARAALNDDAAFDAAWHKGREMPLEQAVALALEATL